MPVPAPAARTARALLAAVAVVGMVAAMALVLRPDAAVATPVGPPATATAVTPDVLRVSVGAEVSADGVDLALSGADDAARRVIAVLDDADVPKADVQTSN